MKPDAQPRCPQSAPTWNAPDWRPTFPTVEYRGPNIGGDLASLRGFIGTLMNEEMAP
jgi:hypothetical protein